MSPYPYPLTPSNLEGLMRLLLPRYRRRSPRVWEKYQGEGNWEKIHWYPVMRDVHEVTDALFPTKGPLRATVYRQVYDRLSGEALPGVREHAMKDLFD